jgi:hypothetical protein
LYLYVFLSYAVLASGIGFKPYLASSARGELGRQLSLAGYDNNRSLVVYNGTKPSWSAVTDGSTGYVVFDSIYGRLAVNSSSLTLYEKSTGKNLEFYILPQIFPFYRRNLPNEIMLDDFRFALYKRVVSLK